MSKKKTATTKFTSPKASRQSAATAHEQEFAELVMAPKFWELLRDHDFDLSYATMTTAYNASFGTRLSTSSIKKYLDILGWKYERKPQWTGLPNMTAVPIPDGTNAVDPAAILREPFDEEAREGENADPTEHGHTIGGPLPGQGKLSTKELELLG